MTSEAEKTHEENIPAILIKKGNTYIIDKDPEKANNLNYWREYVLWIIYDYKKFKDLDECNKKIKKSDFIYSGCRISRQFGGLIKMLLKLFNEHNWLIFKFKPVPKGWWDEKDNILTYMNWLGKQLNYTQHNDWYKIKASDFNKNFGGTLLTNNNSSPIKVIRATFPEYEWLEWKFYSGVPPGFWENPSNCKKYLDWLCKQEKITDYNDMYKINREVIRSNKGGDLADKYNHVYNLLLFVYPEYKWLPWKFKSGVPNNFWKKTNGDLNWDNIKFWFYEISIENNIKNPEDWYAIKTLDIKTGILFNLIKFKDILKHFYPDFDWLPWKFIQPEDGLWDNKEIIEQFFNYVYKQEKIESLYDFYKINGDVYKKHGCGSLFHRKSYIDFLKDIYPNYEWKEYKFISTPDGWWKNKKNQRIYMDDLLKELKLSPEELYEKIDDKILQKHNGSSLVSLYNHNMTKLMTDIYSEINFNKFKRIKHKTEKKIAEYLQNKFPEEKILTGYKAKCDWCRSPDTNFPLPFDIIIPTLKLIIECDGETHFKEELRNPNFSYKMTHNHDIYKMAMTIKNGYSMIRMHQVDVYKDLKKWREKIIEYIEIIKKNDKPKIICSENKDYEKLKTDINDLEKYNSTEFKYKCKCGESYFFEFNMNKCKSCLKDE